MKQNEEAELFAQCYFGMRVVETEEIEEASDGTEVYKQVWRIDASVLGSNTHSWTFYDELEAKAAYKTLENFYIEALKTVQEKMVEIHDELNDAPEYDPSSPTLTSDGNGDKS